MRIVRDVFRRKLRSFLTIFGITIGVLALVVMGSMAEKITKLVDGGVDYYADKVIVRDAASEGSWGVPVTSLDMLDDIEAVDGVAVAVPAVDLLFEDMEGGVQMGVPALISAVSFMDSEYEDFTLEIAEGRDLTAADHGVTVLGTDLADQQGVTVGDTIDMRGEEFEIVGIYEKTLTVPDTTAYVSLEEAQELFVGTLPAAFQETVEVDKVATEIVVYPEAAADADELATTISDEVAGASATGPQEFVETIERSTSTFSAIIIGIALVSLLVGGLSVINTMMMSVSERVREIGIRKAIGASTGSIVRHFVGESAVIGFVGGLIGLALGAGLVVLGNAAGAASGNVLFLLTPRLALGAVAFALVLGVIAGLYPATHAARLDPVVAFRRA